MRCREARSHPARRTTIRHTTPFQLVSAMNTAFGNPKGDYYDIDLPKLRSQCKNIADEFVELLEGLGADQLDAAVLRSILRHSLLTMKFYDEDFDPLATRDALCDIPVFSMGAQHFMGVDGDADMAAVVAGVMTRFIKDNADRNATIVKHATKGVTDVYFEGEYPTMVMKSASDQPDAPKGKFLKSASFKETVFPEIHPTPGEKACARVFD